MSDILLQSGNEQVWNPHLSVVYDKSTKRINLNFQIDCQGCYAAQATYGGVMLKHGDFTILVLDGEISQCRSYLICIGVGGLPYQRIKILIR